MKIQTTVAGSDPIPRRLYGDLVASGIENAVAAPGNERIRSIHPDCGFRMLTRSVADRKMRAPAEGRDLFYGQTVQRGLREM